MKNFRLILLACLMVLLTTPVTHSDVLDKQKLLDAQTFWDNRDWDWYKANIPFFECPDADINTTYYYRWELVTKHLTYGSPSSGYTFSEFINRPHYAGPYGAISCPAGHQLYEVRWLRDPKYAQDFCRYWFRVPEAKPRAYSTWLADATWAVHQVHPVKAFVTDLLPDLVKNYEGWAARCFVPEVGLFWQVGDRDGMELNITSRQTTNILSGGPGYRPSLNAYLWADALAIARAADLVGDKAIAQAFRAKAAGIKEQFQKRLWDPKREFFFHLYKNDERDKEGNVVKAMTLTYQTGKYAGNPHGREQIGYIPWQFNMPDAGFEAAWKFLMDPKFFHAERGPTTVERNDPQFLLHRWCCWWSGQSWPYATTQTLKGLANLLQNYEQKIVTRNDYMKLMRIYALSHRKDGRPYLAEALNPDTGSFLGHDAYNHSEHYFHSGFCDLVITGLTGLKTRDDDTIEIDPLIPAEWDYFALDNLRYRGRDVSIIWDKSGKRYGKGPGLRLFAEGAQIAWSAKLGKLTAELPPPVPKPQFTVPRMNFAVSNDGHHFPSLRASFASPDSTLFKVNDGNYWYLKEPPNRWTCAGSPNLTDWIEADLGASRRVDTVKLYFLDDGEKVLAPADFELLTWDGSAWKPIASQKRAYEHPAGHRAETVTFPPTELQKLRVVLTHAKGGQAGMTELEIWGDAVVPFTVAPPPPGNLALNVQREGFPRTTASFSDRSHSPDKATDGKILFLPTPANRWSAQGSPNKADWIEVDFGAEKEVGRVVAYLFADRAVQAPQKCTVQTWTGTQWRDVENSATEPVAPTAGMANTIRFNLVKTSKFRIAFTHSGETRTGVTELEAWKQ